MSLRDWSTARAAWRGFGVAKISPGSEPIDDDFGRAPVRLPHGEVVWGRRLDPARVKLENIPFPEHGYRWGDVVLNDGEPNGEREHNGRKYPVFDVLERWSPSEIATLVVDAECDGSEDAEALIDLFDHHHFAAEDWTTSVRWLCRACSTGDPGKHDHPFPESGDRGHRFGIACPAGLATTLLDEWVSASPQSRRYEFTPPEDDDAG